MARVVALPVAALLPHRLWRTRRKRRIVMAPLFIALLLAVLLPSRTCWAFTSTIGITSSSRTTTQLRRRIHQEPTLKLQLHHHHHDALPTSPASSSISCFRKSLLTNSNPPSPSHPLHQSTRRSTVRRHFDCLTGPLQQSSPRVDPNVFFQEEEDGKDNIEVGEDGSNSVAGVTVGPQEEHLDVPPSPKELLQMNSISNVPSVSRILQFAIPAIGVWLCSPLLSMIDTSVVGLLSGTLQQAALSPAVVVTDYSARALSFLYTGTTNLMAVAQQQDVGHMEEHHIEKTFVGALRFALLAGSTLGVFLLLFANPLTHALIGSNKYHGLHDPEVFHAAQRYVRIRALGMPAAAVIGTSQAACLGLKDVQSPLRVLVIAAVVNLCSDLLLVGQGPEWLGGAAGAAWATSLSQWFAMTLFLRWLTTSSSSSKAENTKLVPVVVAVETNEESMSSSRLSSSFSSRIRSLLPRKPATESFSTRGLLAQHLNRQTPLFQRPTPEITQGYRPYVIPVTTTQIGRTSTYIAMGHVVASSFGTISMAAHQVITSILYSLIPVADSLSLTMQSFLPGIVAQEPSRERAQALRGTILNLYKVAALFGTVLAGIVAFIPILSKLFTTDPAVQSLVTSIVPILFAIFALHGVFCGSEGILLGQRDLKFLGRVYAVYFFVVPLLMLRIKALAHSPSRHLVGGGGVSLRSVWSLFLGYQLVRILVWVGRVAWLQRRAELQASTITTTTSSVAVSETFSS